MQFCLIDQYFLRIWHIIFAFFLDIENEVHMQI